MRATIVWAIICIGFLLSSCKQAPIAPQEQSCSVSLHLRLGGEPHGRAWAHTPWQIVVDGRPSAERTLDDATLASGETDESGYIKLTKHEGERVSAALCDGSNQVLLIYPGQARRIVVVKQPEHQSEDEELFYRMQSAGYFDEIEIYSESLFGSKIGVGELRSASRDFEVESKRALLEKLREIQGQSRSNLPQIFLRAPARIGT
jgi:hypothetical protein